jgi:hypothetical protein
LKTAFFSFVAPCNVAEVYRCFIAQMMEAGSTSETSVYFYQITRRNNQKAAIFIRAAVKT